jgi:predicted N-acetyltransferase YhbS
MTSLLACAGNVPAGHILFTAARLRPATAQRAAILAPLAVLPARQRHGIGSALVTEGLAVLTRGGVRLVFVLGHPSYYPRFGFAPAGARGFAAPYPIPEKHAEAWMVLALDDRCPAPYAGMVMCAQALDRPEHWRE